MTPPQHMQALNQANKIRVDGAKFRKEVAQLGHYEGMALLASYLERKDCPPEVGALRLDWFIRSVHRFGYSKVAALLRASGIARRLSRSGGELRVRDLTLSERAALAVALREWGERA
jgi:hypothetical protein